MTTSWRYAVASVTGSSHRQAHLPCQDASACTTVTTPDGEEVLIAVVSDGAGSAHLADVGAQLACRSFMEAARGHLVAGEPPAAITKEWARKWILDFQQQVADQAAADEADLKAYSCTLVAAIVARDTAAFLQVGDGVAVISPEAELNDYSWVFWPHHGEYINETMFLTDPRALDTFDFDLIRESFDEVALLTDGLERLALHMESRTAYRPFFEPLFTTMREAATGYSHDLSAGLSAFLGTSRVDERTDDDRTLLLATRLTPAPVFAMESFEEAEIERGDQPV